MSSLETQKGGHDRGVSCGAVCRLGFKERNSKVERTKNSDDDSDHQSHVTTDSETDSEPETTIKPRVERKIFALPGTEVHKKLRTRHLSFEGYVKTFVCGRTIGPLHERTVPLSEFDAPICRHCFSSKQLAPQA